MHQCNLINLVEIFSYQQQQSVGKKCNNFNKL